MSIEDYKQRIEERRIIKQENKTTINIGLGLLLLNVVCGVAAYLIKINPVMVQEELENIYRIANLGVIMMLIVILLVKKIVYYSPKFIRHDFTLIQVLAKWRRIDLTMLLISAIIPICGLVMAFIGMPFEKNYLFFVGSGLLILILMPLGIKVESRLSILRKRFPGI